MAHLTGTLALAGSMLLGSLAGPPADASVESRLEAEVQVRANARSAPSEPQKRRDHRRVLPSLRESKRAEPPPVQVQHDASAGMRI